MTASRRTDARSGGLRPPPPRRWNRWNRGAWIFRDETLPSLEILLDEAFRIPGTRIRFGLDGIIGLVPGMGDVLAGLLSLVIPLAAWIRGVPYVTLAAHGGQSRHWRAGWHDSHLRRHLRYRVESEPPQLSAAARATLASRAATPGATGSSWSLLAALLGLVFALPVVLVVWLVVWLLHQ